MGLKKVQRLFLPFVLIFHLYTVYIYVPYIFIIWFDLILYLLVLVTNLVQINEVSLHKYATHILKYVLIYLFYEIGKCLKKWNSSKKWFGL